MLDRRMVRVPEAAVPAAGMLLSYIENSYKRTWLNFYLPSFCTLASWLSCSSSVCIMWELHDWDLLGLVPMFV